MGILNRAEIRDGIVNSNNSFYHFSTWYCLNCCGPVLWIGIKNENFEKDRNQIRRCQFQQLLIIFLLCIVLIVVDLNYGKNSEWEF